MTVTAYTLAVVLNLFCLFLGYRFLFQPASSAAGYGVPADPGGDAGPYLTIKGLRDGTFGLVGLALLAFAGARAEAWFMLAVALVPLGDTLIVLAARRYEGGGLRDPLRHRGRRPDQRRTALRGLSAPQPQPEVRSRRSPSARCPRGLGEPPSLTGAANRFTGTAP